LELSPIVDGISAALYVVSGSTNDFDSLGHLLHLVVACCVIVMPVSGHYSLKVLWIKFEILCELSDLVCLGNVNEKASGHIILWMNVVAVVV